MDEIERAVVLPKSAKPLEAYGRSYAFSASNKVIATYLIPPPPVDMSQGCEVMLKKFNSRPCTRKEIEEAAKSNAANVAAQTPAGKRRWYDSSRSLPFIMDGGCMQVNVVFEIASRRFISVTCNGYA